MRWQQQIRFECSSISEPSTRSARAGSKVCLLFALLHFGLAASLRLALGAAWLSLASRISAAGHEVDVETREDRAEVVA